MIGSFARIVQGPARVLTEEDLGADAPPERFVEKIPDEGGDVYVAPFLETLRAALRRARGQPADASPDAPQDESRDAGTEARP